jgi:hypothetical protein
LPRAAFPPVIWCWYSRIKSCAWACSWVAWLCMPVSCSFAVRACCSAVLKALRVGCARWVAWAGWVKPLNYAQKAPEQAVTRVCRVLVAKS